MELKCDYFGRLEVVEVVSDTVNHTVQIRCLRISTDRISRVIERQFTNHLDLHTYQREPNNLSMCQEYAAT